MICNDWLSVFNDRCLCCIAQIFYKYFPSLLDIKKVNFEVGVTPKIRTSETADAFIRSLIEFQIGANITSYEQLNGLIKGKIFIQIFIEILYFVSIIRY